MATVDEILMTMADTGEDPVVATDEVLVIDPNTRQIHIPGSELIFGVESDTHAERKYFRAPRMVGNDVDLASCFIRVNFRNANGEIDSYLVNDVVVSDDTVVFSWELSRKATAYKGQTAFVVCASRAGSTAVEWHTTQATGLVLAGLEPDSSTYEAETSDVVAQLLAMVEAQTAAVENEGAIQKDEVRSAATDATSAAVTEIEAKGVNTLATIPNDYTALGEAVRAVEHGMAPGIVCEVEGSAVAVSDASNQAVQGLRIFGRSTQTGTPTPTAPVEIVSVEKPVVTVCGKNLLNLPQTIEKPTTGYNHDLFTGTNGAATAVPLEKLKVLPMVRAGETYYFSYDISDHEGEPALRIIPVNSDGTIRTVNGSAVAMFENKGAFVPSMDSLITIRVGNSAAMTISNIQIEVGTVRTAYEPYSGQAIPTIHSLPGIPVTSGGNYTDSDGQQWICDEVDLERGVYVQRCSKEMLTFTYQEELNRYRASLPKPANTKVLIGNGIPLLCDKYSYAENAGAGTPQTNGIRIAATAPTNVIAYYNGEVIDSATVLYPLATPIETPLSETELAAYRALHTNKPNTTVLNDQGAHMSVAYVADTKLYIDNKITALLGEA